MAGFGGSSSPCKLAAPLPCLRLCLQDLDPSWGGYLGFFHPVAHDLRSGVIQVLSYLSE